MVIAPPGHGKTTTLTVGGTIYDILDDVFQGPGTFAEAIVSRVDGVAIPISEECMAHIRYNDEFREVFGDLVGDKWGATAWNVRGRRSFAKEPTVTTISLNGQIFSKHYPKIRVDDPVQEEDVCTQTQRDKIDTAFFSKLASRPTADGQMNIAGLHVWPYGLMVNLHNDRRLRENTLIIPALIPKDHPLRPVLGPVPWPKSEGGYDPLYFMHEKAQKASRFECVYQGNPQAMEGRIFNLHKVRRYTPEMVTPEKLKRMLVVNAADMAISDSKDADYFVVGSIAVDVNGNVFVLGYQRERGRPFHLQIEAIHTWDVQRRPRVSFLEINAQQRVWQQEAYRKYRMNMFGITHSKDKVRRGFDFQPVVECGKLWLPPSGMGELEEEIRDFPDGEHDDVIDMVMTAHEGSKLLSFPGGN